MTTCGMMVLSQQVKGRAGFQTPHYESFPPIAEFCTGNVGIVGRRRSRRRGRRSNRPGLPATTARAAACRHRILAARTGLDTRLRCAAGPAQPLRLLTDS
jgi:hypothetical protein